MRSYLFVTPYFHFQLFLLKRNIFIIASSDVSRNATPSLSTTLDPSWTSATNAIDGYLNTVAISQTSVPNWFKLDLILLYKINLIIIYNRSDYNPDRMNGCKLILSVIDNKADYKQIATLTSELVQTIVCSYEARYVLITTSEGDGTIQVADINVYI